MNSRWRISLVWLACWIAVTAGDISAVAQSTPETLDQQLLKEDPQQLLSDARRFGDAKRGAVIFYQPQLACTKCHGMGAEPAALGPQLTRLQPQRQPVQLLESILNPSKVIEDKYRQVTIVTNSGQTMSGIIHKQDRQQVVLRTTERPTEPIEIALEDIDEQVVSPVSAMPKGLASLLTSRQQFLDLMNYVLEITEHGERRALELEPPPSLYRLQPLPEYEKRVDHAGLITALDAQAVGRGEKIYERLCINCHGDHERPGSLPTSLRFASGKFKNGSDPYSMYRTLTHGFGMMVAQRWMVPRQKYDVIHYIREAYLKPHNSEQFVEVTPSYLQSLPTGDTFGPEPVTLEPWVTMDYGRQLTASYEFGDDGSNIAYKGIAIRLDPGAGGVTRGKAWLVFDHDTLRMAGAWTGSGFIDFNGIMFNGRHAIHPRVVGQIHAENATGPGWANPETGDFDDPRFRGRDGKPYGPLPREWAQYHGMYYHDDRVVLSYSVGSSDVLESPRLAVEYGSSESTVFARDFEIGPRSQPIILQVAAPRGSQQFALSPISKSGSDAIRMQVAQAEKAVVSSEFAFDGASWLEVDEAQVLDWSGRDFSITARIKTTQGGALITKTLAGPKWVPDGQSLFVRQGKLVFDIGWVGAVRGRRRVNDGQWHDVALTWRHKDARVQLFVDGELDGEGELRPKSEDQAQHVLRIGFGAPDFPRPNSYFRGSIDSIQCYDRLIDPTAAGGQSELPQPVAAWKPAGLSGKSAPDLAGNKLHATVKQGAVKSTAPAATLVAGISPPISGADWSLAGGRKLHLRIPAGNQPLKFTLWFAANETIADSEIQAWSIKPVAAELASMTEGSRGRWQERVTTQIVRGSDDSAFAVDTLSWPDSNPWLCRVRLTGFDFYPDGRRAVVCAWDGDVWLVEGIGDESGRLQWQRIASGLFQPLGLKIVDNQVYVTCRDQLVILRDLNSDGETDFYECFNNDHQVTEHFHEFAMGLQTDDAGNFYYAKSARHALPALVAHHGTLLRVSPDGERTDIVAVGFRAANGVCVNPDGSFIVTDQEGHWNPKNRINWVREGGFYGNMYGYHDVTDTSDAAMEQPLCWITNSFDRSPAELMWVTSDRWAPLKGRLLNFSYGYGKVYVVPHEELNGQMQGGMCEFPIAQFPTGVMRGRFHDQDGQLYCCGMFAWAGTQQKPGGFYRIRWTGKPMHLPVELKARQQGLQVSFTDRLDPVEVAKPDNYAVRIWSLKRTKNYGSKHFDERRLEVTAARLTADGKSVVLTIPELEPTWCMEVRYRLKDSEQGRFQGVIHNTIHHLAE